MIMKALVALGTLAATLVGVVSMTAGQDGTSITIERGGVRLTIPNAYVIERRLGRGQNVEDLDSDEGTVLLRVPASEVRAILPTEPPEFPDLIVSIRLLSAQEAIDVEQHNADMAMRLQKRSGDLSQAIVQKDIDHGWYRLYETPRITFRSYILARPDAAVDDVIALCTKSPGAEESCRLPTFVVRGVGVETSLPTDGLKYRDKISSYLAVLINRWRK